MAEQVAEIFTEVIVAPDYEDGAVEVLPRKKNIRMLRCAAASSTPTRWSSAAICGGLLMQPVDRRRRRRGDDPATWTLATGEAAPTRPLADLAFAWRACRAVKSNAILLAARRRLGRRRHGPGQPGRLLPARRRRGPGSGRAGSVAASDAFFPFEDGPQILIDAGVRAIVQPGGSMRDELTVEAARRPA